MLLDAVGAVGVPVRAGLAKGAFVAILFVTVDAKFASSLSAAASSSNVSRDVGAEFTKFAISVST